MCNDKFILDIDRGRTGEVDIINHLKNNGCYGIIDLSDNKEYQSYDIDLVYFNKYGKLISAEIKTDYLAHKTGNIIYEKYSSKSIMSDGCFEKTKAMYIFYYIYHTNQLYIFNTISLRNYVNNHYKNSQLINCGDNALGYLIRINDLNKNNINYYHVNI